jgi:hypothetical protein
MTEGGFTLQSKSELGSPAKDGAPLTRRRYLDPTSTIDLTPPKKRKITTEAPQSPELTKEAAEMAISLFKDKTRTLSTKDVLQIQAAEAMVHKKGWVPSPELIHKAREFDQRTNLRPHEFYEYQQWKYPKNGPDEEEEAARAKKRRGKKSGIVLSPDFTWSVMAKALKWQIEGMNEALREVASSASRRRGMTTLEHCSMQEKRCERGLRYTRSFFSYICVQNLLSYLAMFRNMVTVDQWTYFLWRRQQ